MLNELDVKNSCDAYGEVVVEITVNREGEVVKAVAGVRNSTTSNICLKRLAKKKALQAKFEPAPEGKLREVGTITFNFDYQ